MTWNWVEIGHTRAIAEMCKNLIYFFKFCDVVSSANYTIGKHSIPKRDFALNGDKILEPVWIVKIIIIKMPPY
jgi:hypothetical protein